MDRDIVRATRFVEPRLTAPSPLGIGGTYLVTRPSIEVQPRTKPFLVSPSLEGLVHESDFEKRERGILNQ